MATGILGEDEHGGWWSSFWTSSNAVNFLTPIYGEGSEAARFSGLVETARRVHDARIGVGRVFHLFRLPEILERRLHIEVVKNNAIDTLGLVCSKDEARSLLAKIAVPIQGREGPVKVGCAADLEEPAWLNTVAGHYLEAFKSSKKTFPYFDEG